MTLYTFTCCNDNCGRTAELDILPFGPGLTSHQYDDIKKKSHRCQYCGHDDRFDGDVGNKHTLNEQGSVESKSVESKPAEVEPQPVATETASPAAPEPAVPEPELKKSDDVGGDSGEVGDE